MSSSMSKRPKSLASWAALVSVELLGVESHALTSEAIEVSSAPCNRPASYVLIRAAVGGPTAVTKSGEHPNGSLPLEAHHFNVSQAGSAGERRIRSTHTRSAVSTS